MKYASSFCCFENKPFLSYVDILKFSAISKWLIIPYKRKDNSLNAHTQVVKEYQKRIGMVPIFLTKIFSNQSCFVIKNIKRA